MHTRLTARPTLLAIACLAQACLSDLVESGAALRLITITPDTIRLVVGTTTTLSVTVSDADGAPIPGAAVAYSTLDPTVTSVTAFGLVTALRPGRTRIVVESAGSAAEAPVDVGLAFTAVSAGTHHTCGLTPVSTLYCWGDNDHGQLGVGDRVDRVLPALVAGQWLAVTAGDEHTCALAADRAAFCWGRGSGGRLGAGAATPAVQPVAVVGGHRYRQIAAGAGHTCGVTTGGVGLCWGTNDVGQIGDGTLVQRHVPQSLALAIPLRHIATGDRHTCAVDTAGLGWCWGANDQGQLAVDTLITVQQPTPRRAAAGRTFTEVRAGLAGSTCGIAPTGTVWCWGRGSEGQLGLGTTPAAQLIPQALTTQLGDTLRFLELALGWAHACGRTTTALMCWGTSRLGQPGLHFAPRPTTVLPGAQQPAAGFAHTCARQASGRVLCWGGGQRGALGTGDLTSSDTPRPVALQLPDPSG